MIKYYLLLDTCTAPDELINPKKKIFEEIQVMMLFDGELCHDILAVAR